MAGKPGVNNPIQKGQRRQRIHEKQDNVGNEKKLPQYKNFDGQVLE